MTHKKLFYGGGAVVLAAVALAALGGYWLVQGPKIIDRDLRGLDGDVNRGAYVARLSGCIACHTDIKAGGKVLAGGAKISTDFGSFYPPNITPDPVDGIGDWDLVDFSRALTSGVSPKGQHLFPTFPYTFYAQMKNQDIVDLWAAVRSVPPVKGKPPKHGLRFPFSSHEGVAVWQRMFFERKPLKEISEKSKAWNRGRYLANGPAHCGACHTPRNLLGGRKTKQQYEGGKGPGGEKIPAITIEALKAGKWSKDDLIYAMRTGVKPDGDVFGGSMGEVVSDATRFWSDQDLDAIATYIMSDNIMYPAASKKEDALVYD